MKTITTARHLDHLSSGEGVAQGLLGRPPACSGGYHRNHFAPTGSRQDRREPTRMKRVALLGMPNSGKSTLFNRLTGAHARVGNWPSITLELLTARLILGGEVVQWVDLPGIYDLNGYSDDEKVVTRFLAQTRPDLVLFVMNATQLDRQPAGHQPTADHRPAVCADLHTLSFSDCHDQDRVQKQCLHGGVRGMAARAGLADQLCVLSTVPLRVTARLPWAKSGAVAWAP